MAYKKCTSQISSKHSGMYSNNCTVTISFPSSLSFGSSRKTKDFLLHYTENFVCVSVILTLTFVPLLSILYTIMNDSYVGSFDLVAGKVYQPCNRRRLSCKEQYPKSESDREGYSLTTKLRDPRKND